ncbi:MAG: hypothetical protein HOV87_20145 [Catenulispora sp.]|nr:hypothetical protein [Catenulispora sp.]
MDGQALIPLSAVGVGLILGLRQWQTGKHGKDFSRAQLQAFAADLRRELYARAALSGEWIDVSDHLRQQPYFPGTWFHKVRQILVKQGILAQPRPQSPPVPNTWLKLTDKAHEEARMERMMHAAENPRNVNNIQAGVVQFGDHNQAHHVNATFGTDQSALLAQLVTALTDVARNTELPQQLRQAADDTAAELRRGEPGRIPAILERLRGMAAVATSGFEAVSPILDALRSVIS